MNTGRFITLFSAPLPPSRSSRYFAASVLLHIALLTIFFLWLARHVPQVKTQLETKNNSLQIIKLDKPKPTFHPPDPQKTKPLHHPLPPREHHYDLTKPALEPDSPSTPTEVSDASPSPVEQSQTLAQQSTTPSQQTQVATNTPSASISKVSPGQQSTANISTAVQQALTVSVIRSVPTLPKTATIPPDIKISPTSFTTPLPIIPPSNVTVAFEPTPINPTKQPQDTNTVPSAPIASTSDMSLSDLHMSDATIALPHGNISKEQIADTPTAIAPLGSQSAIGESTDRISLPKNGQFGVVVVGASLGDQYPEATDLWGGRMPYTVYVHVGLAKSWILQYSLPDSANSATVGRPAHLDAPWPYDIERPNIAPEDINSGALMVHGYVNKEGHFETLAVVSPQQFPQEKFLLDTLRHWQFRPAEENGHDTDVEILLIIPDELN